MEHSFNLISESKPPQNLDAEQAVLGSILLEPKILFEIEKIIAAEDFYLSKNRLIFQALTVLIEQGQNPDLLTLTDWLTQKGQLDSVGGVVYLASLIMPTAANAEEYAKIVKEKSVLRHLVALARQIAEQGYQEQDSQQLLLEAEKAFAKLSEQQLQKNFVGFPEAIVEVFKLIEQRFRNQGQISGLTSGFADLDRLCCGLQPGDLIIVAGRPAMGKTSFGLTIAHNVAMQNKPVAVFSLEMSVAQLTQRIICAESMVDQQKVRTGKLTGEDWGNLVQAVGRLSKAQLFIDDTGGLNIRQLRAKAKSLQAKQGLALIVIDYLQLLSGSNRENRQQEISEISRSLKNLAKELNLPIIALSQLSRAVEQRQDKIPMMSDLRESGSLEQDADVIMFIYRDEYYNEDSEKKGIAEIIVAKQRNGPTGTVELAFIKEFTKFVNLAKE